MDNPDVSWILGVLRHLAEQAFGVLSEELGDGDTELKVLINVGRIEEDIHRDDDAVWSFGWGIDSSVALHGALNYSRFKLSDHRSVFG